MATLNDVARLRRLIDEPAENAGSTYTDQDLLNLLASYNDDMDQAAASIWEEKAAGYAQMVNVKEGPSSRDLGSLYANAIKMAQFFGGGGSDAGGGASNVARTRKMVREGGF